MNAVGDAVRVKEISVLIETFPLVSGHTVWITTNSGKFLEMGVPDHFTCFLRNLYAGQEVTIKTGYGTRLVSNWEKSTSKLYIVTLLI